MGNNKGNRHGSRFSNAGALSWSRLERILSGVDTGPLHAVGVGEAGRHEFFSTPTPAAAQSHGGGEALSVDVENREVFAELHAVSSFNFLQGASDPEVMVETAAELGISTLALLDSDGLYGASRFALAAAEHGVRTVFGAELHVFGAAGPALGVLCRGEEGYRRLSRAITDAAMVGQEKGTYVYPSLSGLAELAQGHWYVLIDWQWGDSIVELVNEFGAQRCIVEYQHTMDPQDWDRNERLHQAVQEFGLQSIVSARPNCAVPAAARLAGVKTALHDQLDVASATPTTAPTGGRWLRTGAEMLQLAGDCPWLATAVETSVQIARECAFTLNLIAPALPHYPVPSGHDEMSWLRELVMRKGATRYGARSATQHGATTDGDTNRAHAARQRAWEVIDHELDIIEQLGFPGYFLIVHDIVDFCHTNNIYCQGRGSAANSAVCFALGITNVDAVAAGLLFERFLSPERDGPPDIDIDIESGRREEVIQYVYQRYGRDNAAQVANVITYRRKGAVRDAGRALGFSQGHIDAWSRGTEEPPAMVATIADQLMGQPRHLGIHSGGMVICDRPIADVVPTEWARKEGRSVVQWDKDDCATVGLVKFDLLGLGMLEALHHAIDAIREHRDRDIALWQIEPTDPKVFAMLAAGDAVGVFQVESRAQLATLPRLRPRTFYDLVVQVALIRPGPIQGGSVHPYIRRRNGLEPVTFDHPSLEPALTKTLGIPLFQEQLMQVVVDAAGFSAAEADTLRRAMGSKRSPEKMAKLQARFFQGLQETNNITGDVAQRLWDKIVAFASYGFPESHAQSFASLVYYSAWLKCYYPAEFCVALLKAQPMGFYSPQSLIADARRHGVAIRPVDIAASQVQASVEDVDMSSAGHSAGHSSDHGDGRRADFKASAAQLTPAAGEPVGAIRLGLQSIKGISEQTAQRIVEVRERIGGYRSITDLAREAELNVAEVEKLAAAGALDSLGYDRRQSLWAAGIAATEQRDMLPGTSTISAPALPGMSAFELAAADLTTTGITPNLHPVELLRNGLDRWAELHGGVPVITASQLLHVPDGTRIRVAGAVTHRQRPYTAGGVVFLGLEDETGLANIMISEGLWKRQRTLAVSAPLVVIRGIVYNSEGSASVTADLIEAIPTSLATAMGKSRDFQ